MADLVAEAVAKSIEKFRAIPGGLLPLLHDLQDSIGYIPAEAVPGIAAALRLSRAEVHGVVSFYHDFRSAPAGSHVLQICRAEACQSMGARALEAHARVSLGIDYGETTADGAITLEPVYCLGNCACAPSVRLDDEVHARVDAARLDDILAELGREAGR